MPASSLALQKSWPSAAFFASRSSLASSEAAAAAPLASSRSRASCATRCSRPSAAIAGAWIAGASGTKGSTSCSTCCHCARQRDRAKAGTTVSALSARRSAQPRSASKRSTAVAIPLAPGATTIAFQPSIVRSGSPPTFVVMTALRVAIASRQESDVPSANTVGTRTTWLAA